MRALVFDLNLAKAALLKAFGPWRKELYYRGPLSMLSLADVPEPRLVASDWVKIRVRMCGFCGSDLNLILIKESPLASPFTSFPAIMGHEFWGEVVETGRDVNSCRSGDLVAVSPMLNCTVRGINPSCRACQAGRPGNCENLARGPLAPGMFMGVCKDVGGGFAEYVLAHKDQIFPIPHGVSPESATLIEPLAVALQAVLDNRPVAGENVLVIGGGVIGLMLVKVLRALAPECTVTVVEPSPFARQCAESAGADHVTAESALWAAERFTGAISYRSFLGQRILQGGFDRVYDTVGHSTTVRAALNAMAALGTLSLVGIADRIAFDPTPIWLKLQTIKGAFGYGYNATPQGAKHTFEIALDLLSSGRIQVQDMLTHTFPIENYQAMIAVNLAKGKNRAIKTAVAFS